MKTISHRIIGLVALLAIVATPLVAQTVTKEQRENILKSVTNAITKYAFVPGVDFKKWPEFLDAERNEIDKAETPNEFALAVNKALQKFGASHIVFNTPEAVKQLREGRVVGIGISPLLVPEGIKINDVFPNSPAAKAGLEIGDVIIEADGKKPETITALRGPEDAKVTLKVKKAKNDKTAMIDIVRKPFSINLPETLKWPSRDVAVLKVPSFMNYDAKNVEKLMSQASKAKTLVIDVRSNGGGKVISLLHLLSFVVPQQTETGSWITRSMVDKFVAKTGGQPTDLATIAKDFGTKVVPLERKAPPFRGRVIGLINGGSGSASEMFAAAIKDTIGATLIGSKTAGQVLASILVPMPEGYQLQYPFQDYVTLNGVRLEGNGVKPDFEAATPKSPVDPDPAVELAVKLAHEKQVAGKHKGGA